MKRKREGRHSKAVEADHTEGDSHEASVEVSVEGVGIEKKSKISKLSSTTSVDMIEKEAGKYDLEASPSFLGSLTWRRAVKAFGTEGPIPDVSKIAQAIQFAPTSIGVQPFVVRVFSDKEVLKSLAPACYNQPQLSSCTHLFVFCAFKDAKVAAERVIAKRALPETNPLAKMIRGAAESHHKAGTSLAWCRSQTYIALGFALAAAAESRIAACPMEGFNGDALGKAMDLEDELQPVVIMTVGRSHPDEAVGTGGHPQWRFPLEDIVKGL